MNLGYSREKETYFSLLFGVQEILLSTFEMVCIRTMTYSHSDWEDDRNDRGFWVQPQL